MVDSGLESVQESEADLARLEVRTVARGQRFRDIPLLRKVQRFPSKPDLNDRTGLLAREGGLVEKGDVPILTQGFRQRDGLRTARVRQVIADVGRALVQTIGQGNEQGFFR